MNATSIDELRGTSPQREVRDEKMEQVRQLLIGDHAREVATRFMLMEARVRELETGVARQLEAIQGRLDALAADTTGDRRAAFDDLARQFHDLGERIGGIAKR